MGVHVTAHAISRYRERVAPVSADHAAAILSTDRIARCVEFGAREIILGTGHHAVVADGCIVTVRPKARGGKLRTGRPNPNGGKFPNGGN